MMIDFYNYMKTIFLKILLFLLDPKTVVIASLTLLSIIHCLLFGYNDTINMWKKALLLCFYIQLFLLPFHLWLFLNKK
jgi:hypothetical protein